MSQALTRSPSLATHAPEAPHYSVSITIDGKTHAEIWHAHTPLRLGHPTRWVLERVSDGSSSVARVRYVGGKLGVRAPHWVSEFSPAQVTASTRLPLPGSTVAGDSIALTGVREIAPAFAPEAWGGELTGKRLALFQCAGQWIVGVQPLGSTPIVARSGGQDLFRLSQPSSGQVQIEPIASGLALWKPSHGGATPLGSQPLTLSGTEIAQTIVAHRAQLWRIGALPDVSWTDSRVGVATREQAEQRWFVRSMVGAGLFVLLLLGAAKLLPEPTPKGDLIPEQFTKIVMAPQTQAAPAPAGTESAAPSAAPDTAKKATETKVAQAFRAQALQNAVSGLLKGGMTKLLAQSDFVAGSARNTDSRKMFNGKADALRATATAVGEGDAPKVNVAAVGGEATGGSGVGYRKGQHAGVSGQGQSFVSMDIAASSVEEGLSKDEVGAVIHKHLSEVRYCYESAMIRTPDLQGKLVVGFTIGATGAVKTANVQTSTLPDPRLDDCILRRLVTWKFPQTKGGVDVAVSYPFIFKTLGR